MLVDLTADVKVASMDSLLAVEKVESLVVD